MGKGGHLEKGAKVGKTEHLFLIQKHHQFVFAALFELLMFHICHNKMNDFDAENFTKTTAIVKKIEDGLVQQKTFVG